MRISQREVRAVFSLFGHGSLKTKLMALLVLVSAVAGLFFTGTVGGHGLIEGRVVGVADGDTITVLALGNSPEKVRFAFIDAPEKAQPHGQAAKMALSARLFGREVKVEVIEKDRYGRTVGRVWVDNVDVNLAQVEDGYAWHYAQYAKKNQSASDFQAYQQAEHHARQNHLGLWQDASPTAPWEYRQSKRDTVSN